MLVIVDARAPQKAITGLEKITGDMLLFKSEGITYSSVSGHPDVFIYQDGTNLIIAPNAPDQLVKFLINHRIDFIFGSSEVGKNLETSTSYNCIATEKNLFHKSGYTDKSIVEKNRTKEFVNLPQAYTRCSMMSLSYNSFITSDKGIQKVLKGKGYDCFYFDPSGIKIHGHKNGFLGGTCGIYKREIFFLGNISLHNHGAELKNFIEVHGYEIVTLCNEKLYDGGGIFFI